MFKIKVNLHRVLFIKRLNISVITLIDDKISWIDIIVLENFLHMIYPKNSIFLCFNLMHFKPFYYSICQVHGKVYIVSCHVQIWMCSKEERNYASDRM